MYVIHTLLVIHTVHHYRTRNLVRYQSEMALNGVSWILKQSLEIKINLQQLSILSFFFKYI